MEDGTPSPVGNTHHGSVSTHTLRIWPKERKGLGAPDRNAFTARLRIDIQRARYGAFDASYRASLRRMYTMHGGLCLVAQTAYTYTYTYTVLTSGSGVR